MVIGILIKNEPVFNDVQSSALAFLVHLFISFLLFPKMAGSILNFTNSTRSSPTSAAMRDDDDER